jgi:hypothetical protein
MYSLIGSTRGLSSTEIIHFVDSLLGLGRVTEAQPGIFYLSLRLPLSMATVQMSVQKDGDYIAVSSSSDVTGVISSQESVIEQDFIILKELVEHLFNRSRSFASFSMVPRRGDSFAIAEMLMSSSMSSGEQLLEGQGIKGSRRRYESA